MFTNAENLYRVYITGRINEQPINFAVSMEPLSYAAVEEFPEVRKGVFIRASHQRVTLKYDDQKFFEDEIMFASPDFFSIFTFDLLQGSPEQVLAVPNSIVLTKALAEKYFGDDDPIGKILSMNNQDDYQVSGIVADPPSNTHITFSGVCSMPKPELDGEDPWSSISGYTYFELEKNTNLKGLEEKLFQLIADRTGINLEEHGIIFTPLLQPVADIHLKSDLDYDNSGHGSMSYVITFSAIALFILLIACFNFMNLTTSRSINRSLEIGVRKVMGADRKRIIFQFLGESIFLTIIASLISMVLIEILLPPFNTLVNKELTLEFTRGLSFIPLWATFIILTGIFAGSYPALYLSRFNPIIVIRGKAGSGKGKSGVRNSLVLIQFIISITMIASTGIIFQQLRYFQNKDLGFDREHVMIMSLNNQKLIDKSETLRQELLNIPGVQQGTKSSNYPMSGGSEGHGMYPEGYSDDKPWLFKTTWVDYTFLETFGIELLQGRNFSKEFSTDDTAVLINETAARHLGWDDPIGKVINDSYGQEDSVRIPFKVIGVVKDFHINPLRDPIDPTVLLPSLHSNRTLSLRLAPENTLLTLEKIQEKWQEFAPDMPMDYRFLDEHFNRIHRVEQNFGKVFIYFTSLAIFLACLGLFGLASYATERRRKEIGIRKVLGSSVRQIVLLLTKEFTRWVLLANLVAWPIAWYGMSRWLENFAYRIDMGIFVFIFAGLSALIVALMTVSWQAVRAAIANPVIAIKHE